jgi:hypothetical protein
LVILRITIGVFFLLITTALTRQVEKQDYNPVTSLSIAFSKAVASGRKTPPPLATRERVLVTLLRKRAAAYNAGADDLEFLLRQQILWSLPTRYRDHDAEADYAERRVAAVA